MKAMKKALALGLALAMVVTAVPVTSAQAASTAKLSASKVSVAAGTAKKQTKSVKVTTPSTWKSVKVTASSSDKKIATVKVSGKTVKVTAVKKGSAKVTVKVSAKKSGKAVKKTLTAKVKVINAGLRFVDPATEVVVGESVTLTAKKCPKAAVVTFKSSDDTIATVDADGKVTAVKAGKVTITATSDYGKKVTTDVTVKDAVAQLTAVKQTASNAFEVSFSADASKAANKDNIKVTSADATASEMTVKSVTFSEDGKTAQVVLYNNLTNDVVYNVVYNGVTVPFTAKVGDVAKVVIKTASAEKDVATKIDFALYDANEIDVTPSVSIDATCLVSVESGSYTASDLSRASKATITLGKVDDVAEVKVTYNSNKIGAQDVTATQKITCVANTATIGGDIFYQTPNDVNKYSSCGRFYNNKKSTVAIAKLNGASDPVYFCATDKNGDAISYDSYTVESANEGIALATVKTSAEKYAVIELTGISAGNTQVNVTAEKNGVATHYVIPVTAKKVGVAASMTVTIKYSQMSDITDKDYENKIEAQLYDSNGDKVDGTYTFTDITKVTTGHGISALAQSGNTATTKAAGANPQTYTIQVEGSDNVDGKKFIKNISFVVKHLDPDKTYKLSYQVEVENNFGGKISPYTLATSSAVTTKLYATVNGLFAGYVRSTGSAIEVAEGSIKATTDSAIAALHVGVKYGTLSYTTTSGLLGKNGVNVTSGAAVNSSNNAKSSFKVATDSGINWDVDDQDMYNTVARVGSYHAIYYVAYKDDTEKTVQISRPFSIANDVVVPTVTVLTKVPDSLDANGAIDSMITNVDMNNVDSNASITIPDGGAYSSNGTRYTVKDVRVTDDYTASNNLVWTFDVPVNTTFRTE